MIVEDHRIISSVFATSGKARQSSSLKSVHLLGEQMAQSDWFEK